MSESSMPNAQDLVLGGEMPPPVGGAVLGGLLGLQQRFEQSELAQKLAALETATKYGAEAIPLLQQGLEDADLTVRSTAYSQLRKMGVSSPDLERGIPLRVGDRIYAVYESSVSYGDDLYYIGNRISEWYEEKHDLYHSSKDAHGHVFECVSDALEDNLLDPYDEGYDPRLIAYYLNAAVAEARAKVIYEEKFDKLGCEIYEIEQYAELEENDTEEAFDLKNWVEMNQIIVDANLPESWGDHDGWSYRNQVMMSLQKQKRFSLLRELWQRLGYGPLAFVHEYVIDRPCYLRLSALER